MLLEAWAAAIGLPAFVTSTVAEITGTSGTYVPGLGDRPHRGVSSLIATTVLVWWNALSFRVAKIPGFNIARPSVIKQIHCDLAMKAEFRNSRPKTFSRQPIESYKS
jgi:hypothetical protein